MRKRIAGTIVALSFGGAMLATGGVASADQPSCNWGQLTKYAIQEVEIGGEPWDQGDHSADPSGDGHGPGTVDEPRAGLANVSYALFEGERGDLQTTCEFIESTLP